VEKMLVVIVVADYVTSGPIPVMVQTEEQHKFVTCLFWGKLGKAGSA
jgi:hypothetical protein